MLGYWGLLSYIGATLYCHSMYMQAGHVQCLLALVLLTTLQLPVNNTLNPYKPPPPPFPRDPDNGGALDSYWSKAEWRWLSNSMVQRQ